MLRIVPAFVLGLTTAAFAQDSGPFQRVAWKLADFVILGDSTYGVQLLASPNLRSEAGRGGHATTALSVDPGAAHKWASGVSKIVDSVSHLSPGQRTVFETIPLATNLGEGRIFVAFDGKGSTDKPFVFVVNGRTQNESWWLSVSNRELQQLFGAIDSVANHGKVRLTPPTAETGGRFLICQLDERPQLIDRAGGHHPDDFRALARSGRVLARYVIDTAGVIPAERIEILLTDGKAFTSEVHHVLTSSTYRPGRKDGRVVETVVWQWFNFTSN